MKRNEVIGLCLLIFAISGIITCSIVPTVSAYQSTPVQSGTIYDDTEDVVAANYGTVTRYDASSGGNDKFFFCAVESHGAYYAWYDYWIIYSLKITVSGTKPDGSPISGLEFTNLATLDSPHDTGSDPWYYVFTAVWGVIKEVIPLGAVEDLVNGQEAGGTGFDGTSAWAEWMWDRWWFHETQDKGLAFRFSLHCDPSLPGIYTLNIHYRVDVYNHVYDDAPCTYFADIFDTIQYNYIPCACGYNHCGCTNSDCAGGHTSCGCGGGSTCTCGTVCAIYNCGTNPCGGTGSSCGGYHCPSTTACKVCKSAGSYRPCGGTKYCGYSVYCCKNCHG